MQYIKTLPRIERCCVEAYDMKRYTAKLITALIWIIECTLPVSGEAIASATLSITLYVPPETEPGYDGYDGCSVERNGSTIIIEAK